MAEHKALQRCAKTLTNLLQHQVVTISTSLLAKGLSTNDLHGWVLTANGVSNKEKAARILASVIDQVKARTQSYGLFIEVLEENSCSDAVEMILEYLDSETAELGSYVADRIEKSDVADRIEKFESRFRAIHKNILSELDSKKVPVRGLLDSLTMLPVKLKQEYGQSISEKLPDLRREEQASDLFLYHLNPLVNFIDYHLVEYIVKEFGSNTLKIEIRSYAADLLVFMKTTTLKEFMEHCNWFGKEAKSRKLSKLIAKIDGDPATYSLYDLDQLRKRFCAGVKMTEVVFVLIGLDSANSFLALWAVPTVLVPQLIEAAKSLDFGFYLHLHILKVMVDDRQIFPFLLDSKSKVPALQAEATAVTDPKDVENTDQDIDLFLSGHDIAHLPSSVEHPGLSPGQPWSIDNVSGQLGDCASYKGVAIDLSDYPLLENIWSSLEPTFKHISLHRHIHSHDDFKSLITAVAQYRDYPETSPPFVMAVFVRGLAGPSVGTLNTMFGSVDIVDDIIKPFLPQSAPHLMNIPKLFFINSAPLLHQDIEPLPYPDYADSNYCVAYCIQLHVHPTRSWYQYIIKHLLSGISVEDVVESSRLIAYNGHLHYFSRLKNKQLTLSK